MMIPINIARMTDGDDRSSDDSSCRVSRRFRVGGDYYNNYYHRRHHRHRHLVRYIHDGGDTCCTVAVSRALRVQPAGRNSAYVYLR